jgi:hypothetical protein
VLVKESDGTKTMFHLRVLRFVVGAEDTSDTDGRWWGCQAEEAEWSVDMVAQGSVLIDEQGCDL